MTKSSVERHFRARAIADTIVLATGHSPPSLARNVLPPSLVDGGMFVNLQ